MVASNLLYRRVSSALCGATLATAAALPLTAHAATTAPTPPAITPQLTDCGIAKPINLNGTVPTTNVTISNYANSGPILATDWRSLTPAGITDHTVACSSILLAADTAPTIDQAMSAVNVDFMNDYYKDGSAGGYYYAKTFGQTVGVVGGGDSYTTIHFGYSEGGVHFDVSSAHMSGAFMPVTANLIGRDKSNNIITDPVTGVTYNTTTNALNPATPSVGAQLINFNFNNVMGMNIIPTSVPGAPETYGTSATVSAAALANLVVSDITMKQSTGPAAGITAVAGNGEITVTLTPNANAGAFGVSSYHIVASTLTQGASSYTAYTQVLNLVPTTGNQIVGQFPVVNGQSYSIANMAVNGAGEGTPIVNSTTLAPLAGPPPAPGFSVASGTSLTAPSTVTVTGLAAGEGAFCVVNSSSSVTALSSPCADVLTFTAPGTYNVKMIGVEYGHANTAERDGTFIVTNPATGGGGTNPPPSGTTNSGGSTSGSGNDTSASSSKSGGAFGFDDIGAVLALAWLRANKNFGARLQKALAVLPRTKRVLSSPAPR